MQNKRLALNHLLFSLVIIAIAFALFFWDSSKKYQSKIDRLQGQIDATEVAIMIKQAETDSLKIVLDSLKIEAKRVDTIEVQTIKYYEVKKNEILSDSADADLRSVRSFLRSVELPN